MPTTVSAARARVAKQPPPKPGEGDVWLELIAALPPDLEALRPLCEARREQGITKHGCPLQRDNGREHPADAVQELLDAAVYLQAGNLPDLALASLRLALLVEEASKHYDLPW